MTLILVHEPGRPYSKDDIYLGPWALPPEVQYEENLPNVLPYHYDDRALLESDHAWSLELADRWLGYLAAALNELHGIDWPKRSWEVVLMPWLLQFIQIVIDRTRSLAQARARFDLESLPKMTQLTVPFNYSDAIADQIGVGTYASQQALYLLILKLWLNQEILLEFKSERHIKPRSFLKRIGVALLKRVCLLKSPQALGISPEYLSRGKLFLHYLKSKGALVPLWELEQPRNFPYFELNSETRNAFETSLSKLSGMNTDSEIEKAVTTVLPGVLAKLCPVLFIEGWGWLTQNTVDLSNLSGVITHNRMYWDEIFTVSVATQKVKNPKFTYSIAQHGGAYGQLKWSEPESLERKISDFFLSWGWESDYEDKVLPISSPKIEKTVKKLNKTTATILYVTNTIPKNFYKNWAFPIGGRAALALHREEHDFLKGMQGFLRKTIVVKCHPAEWGWTQKKRLKTHFPDLEIHGGREKFGDLITKFKLSVHNFNTTTYLETLSWNLPTIIFFDQRYWELRESAKPYFELLKTVGIYHESGKSAAEFINVNFDRVVEWWGSPEVQSARAQFINRFAKSNPNWIQDVLSLIKES